MTTDNNDNTTPDTDDLNAFEGLFYGTEKPSNEDIVPTDSDEEEEVETSEDDSLAEDDTDDSKPEPKKKSRFQERINDLTAKAKEREREAEELRQRLLTLEKELEARQNPPKKEPDAPTEAKAPSPDDKSDDGEDKYPLGEFDPKYIRDLTLFSVKQANLEAEAAREAKEAEKTKAEAEKQAQLKQLEAQKNWDKKLDAARERYEDFDEKNTQLIEKFVDVDPGFGQYIANTIMSMDAGDDVLYYLSNNVDEAEKIMSLDPVRATIALGRIESRFVKGESSTIKVSDAPDPPPVKTKGTSSVKSIRPDTDDLDAFERLYYQKR